MNDNEVYRRLFPATLLFSVVVSAASAAAAFGAVDCEGCHEQQSAEFAKSVHPAAGVVCLTCHGGSERYTVEPNEVDRLRKIAAELAAPDREPGPAQFDHGDIFKGKPSRAEIPERCGTCHSDVSKMNPYGLPTDQLAQYRISGHGRSLYIKNDDRVAVCADCHGVHGVYKVKDPASSVYPTNVPKTCGRCHSDKVLIDPYGLNNEVVEQYAQSVHGKGLLEGGDIAMPHCATCHGSHSAIPPGYNDVGHVCGRCHQQEEKNFLASHHAQFPLFPRCVGCHAATVDKRDHRIARVVATPEAVKKAYAKAIEAMPDGSPGDPEFLQTFATLREPHVQHFETICERCHDPEKKSGHGLFLKDLHERTVKLGSETYKMLRDAELRFVSVADRVDRISRGVLLVRDEAMMVEELRTNLVGLGPLQHTLDPVKLNEAKTEMDALAEQIDASLDKKASGLRLRHWGLLPMWAFLIVFCMVMWAKYKRLKKAWVIKFDAASGGSAE